MNITMKMVIDMICDKLQFICQIEALETIIYITEVANKHGDSWIENAIR